jgi:hypothetical protein
MKIIKQHIVPNQKKSSKTVKTANKEKYLLDKSNQAYLYIKELKTSKEIIQKRTKTANLIKQKLIKQNTKNNFKNSVMFRPTLNKASQEKKVLNNQKKQIGIMNDPNNPYSIYYPNKFLEQKYNVEIGVKGFINGVPIIDTRKKKDDNFFENNIKGKKKISGINYTLNISKEEKKRKIEGRLNNDDKKIENENNNLFNTNQKNFFKFRKDIIEEPEYKEEDNSIDEIEEHVKNLKNKKEKEKNLKEFEEIKKLNNNTKEKNSKTSIQFPEIYKYFRKVS